MKENREPIKNWFGFTRRERRSTFMLLLLIILIIILRYIVPEKNIAIEDITTSISGVGSPDRFLSDDKSSIEKFFSFDPNTASYDNLIKLGLGSKEASMLINYRSKGGKFRHPSDIKKVYGIDDKQAEKLIPYVEVETYISEKIRTNTLQKQKPLLDINICDSASLVRLPGIGPVLSARIIKYRHLLGGYASINQLKEVYGLRIETFELIKGRIYADSLRVNRININSADFKELSRLPYFEKYEVIVILKYRELNGRIYGINDLTENKLITVEKALKLEPYLTFE